MADPASSRASPPRGAARWLRPAGAALSALLVAALLVSPVFCWAGAAESVSAAAVEPVPRPLREPPDALEGRPEAGVDVAEVLDEVAAAATGARGRLAVVVLDADGRPVVRSPEADRPVYAASLVKLLVVQQLLAREAAGLVTLDPGTRQAMEQAITASDDGAMNLLWDAHDGAALVRAAAADFGLTGTAPPAEPGQWGQATTTASDVARFLAMLADAPEGSDSAVVLGWMRAATAIAADGFDQTFGVLSGGVDGGVAAKQGWMCCVDGYRQLHSVGVLADGRVVVLLAEAPGSSSWGQLAQAVDGATSALVAGTA